eukprot:9491237-Pyramimonas_sp.AAC.2
MAASMRSSSMPSSLSWMQCLIDSCNGGGWSSGWELERTTWRNDRAIQTAAPNDADGGHERLGRRPL